MLGLTVAQIKFEFERLTTPKSFQITKVRIWKRSSVVTVLPTLVPHLFAVTMQFFKVRFS
jgi:hypothetical protein